MPTVLDEGSQRYTFDDDWQVERYDNVGVHKRMCACLQAIKGVDFAGFHGGNAYLVEVKDFRGYRIQNKKRLSTGELAEEIASKVLHSLPGLLAESRGGNLGALAKVGRQVPKSSVKVFVVLHLEDDAAASLDQWKQQLHTQAQLIEKLLRWIPCRVIVTSRTATLRLPGVIVSNI